MICHITPPPEPKKSDFFPAVFWTQFFRTPEFFFGPPIFFGPPNFFQTPHFFPSDFLGPSIFTPLKIISTPLSTIPPHHTFFFELFPQSICQTSRQINSKHLDTYKYQQIRSQTNLQISIHLASPDLFNSANLFQIYGHYTPSGSQTKFKTSF